MTIKHWMDGDLMSKLVPGRVGQTTRQLAIAPPNAFFVWRSFDKQYPSNICRNIGREDIEIISVSNLRNKTMGRGNIIVVDHSVKISVEEKHYIIAHNNKV